MNRIRARAHAIHETSGVTVDDAACRRYASSLAPRRGQVERPFAELCAGLTTDRELALRVYFGSVNYSFVDPVTGAQFACDVGGRTLHRSHALFGALASSAIPFEDTESMRTMTAGSLARALNGRVSRLRVFADYLASAGIHRLSESTWPFFDAVSLVEFFGTSGLYDDEFLKRAQVTAYGIALLLGRMDGVELLTCMPETRLIQLLCSKGMLVPTQEMRARIDAQPLLESGDPLERALRAGVIVAGERIAALAGLSEAEVDALLWSDAQQAMRDGTLTVPALRVRTDAY